MFHLGSSTTTDSTNIDANGDFFTVDFGNKFAHYDKLLPPTDGLTHQGVEVAHFLSALRFKGVSGPVSLIAHSNGGLAARAFLVANPPIITDPAVSTSDVAELITYGTPHWGADILRLQTLGNPLLLIKFFEVEMASAILDPAIQGARDALLKGCNGDQPILSDFLDKLNDPQRPLPNNTRYVSIIGQAPFFPIGNRTVFDDCHSRHWDTLVPTSSASLNGKGLLAPEPVRTIRTNEFHVGQGNDYSSILCALDLNCLRFDVYAPVDVEITAPDGRSMSKQMAAVPGASYVVVQDPDGHPETSVVIPFPRDGEYTVKVIPKPGASPTDTYTLEVTRGDTTQVLAQDQQIQDILPEPFVVNVSKADIDGDGDIDRSDQRIFHSSLGSCVGDADLVPTTDYNASGCTDFDDYRIWFEFYWDFAPPQPCNDCSANSRSLLR
jgi:hypothetical protein